MITAPDDNAVVSTEAGTAAPRTIASFGGVSMRVHWAYGRAEHSPRVAPGRRPMTFSAPSRTAGARSSKCGHATRSRPSPWLTIDANNRVWMWEAGPIESRWKAPNIPESPDHRRRRDGCDSGGPPDCIMQDTTATRATSLPSDNYRQTYPGDPTPRGSVRSNSRFQRRDFWDGAGTRTLNTIGAPIGSAGAQIGLRSRTVRLMILGDTRENVRGRDPGSIPVAGARISSWRAVELPAIRPTKNGTGRWFSRE